ncbi:M56 family metallopeptidase [Actinomadura rupiterrae]|uniref:M56 family metallopeptidase n=1 Tax=Actinomadura rupiterrae TaxID=559627 RepID=UPI0020A4FC74|nr:M56 family metallopeptidase [Actinomadura rupiterrae]MCP2336328.1 beta-lactamase regulating signal transducer with metallopeptidase domain [Actinomadura rupiterrae]
MLVLAVQLVVLIVVLGCCAGPSLDGAAFPRSHPASAVLCWTGAILGLWASLFGLVTLVLFWPPAAGHGFAELLSTCLTPHHHRGLLWGALASCAVAVLCSVRLSRGVPRAWRTVRSRRRHRSMLGLVARADDRHPDVLLLDHPLPVAYCLPAGARSIVISSGARSGLAPDELAAVLAHERAHLRQRHHALLMLLDLSHAALPWLPTLRRAAATVPLLLEMAADDAAVRRHGPRTVRSALERLTLLPGPSGTLAATGPTSADGPAEDRPLTHRLARLDDPPRTGRLARPLARAAAIASVAAPLAAVALTIAAIPPAC